MIDYDKLKKIEKLVKKKANQMDKYVNFSFEIKCYGKREKETIGKNGRVYHSLIDREIEYELTVYTQEAGHIECLTLDESIECLKLIDRIKSDD